MNTDQQHTQNLTHTKFPSLTKLLLTLAFPPCADELDNEIGDAGIAALALALKGTTGLQRLHLGSKCVLCSQPPCATSTRTHSPCKQVVG